MKDFKVFDIEIDEIDKDLILNLQQGIEIVDRPYYEISKKLNVSEDEVVERLKKMRSVGFIRKNAIATNQYKLGYFYNVMSVWNVEDEKITEVSKRLKEIQFISHCYIRPRVEGVWNYNLYCMIHAKSEIELECLLQIIKEKISGYYLEYTLLKSTKILKKTGVRLKGAQNV